MPLGTFYVTRLGEEVCVWTDEVDVLDDEGKGPRHKEGETYETIVCYVFFNW